MGEANTDWKRHAERKTHRIRKRQRVAEKKREKMMDVEGI